MKFKYFEMIKIEAITVDTLTVPPLIKVDLEIESINARFISIEKMKAIMESKEIKHVHPFIYAYTGIADMTISLKYDKNVPDYATKIGEILNYLDDGLEANANEIKALEKLSSDLRKFFKVGTP
jgi:hypothetical protein